MKNDPTQWLKGWLSVEIKGDREAFLEAGWELGLSLEKVVYTEDGLRFQVMLSQAGLLGKAVRRSRCRMFIRRHGWPFLLNTLLRRPLLLLGAVCLIAALSFCCSIVEEVGVRQVGGEALSLGEIEALSETLSERGIEPGRSYWYMDLENQEQYIENSFPQLFYVQIRLEGRKLFLEVARRSDVSEGVLQYTGDLLAGAAGIVQDVLVLQGTAAVEPGDTVLPGDVLIYGIQGADPVTARGLVIAQVWGEGQGCCSLEQARIEETGEKRLRASVRFGTGAWLRIWGRQGSGYSLSWQQCIGRWRNQALPVEIIISEIRALEQHTISYTQQQALEAARQEAWLMAQRQLLQEQNWSALQIVNSQILQESLDQQQAQVSLLLEARADISVFLPHGSPDSPPLPFPEPTPEDNP